MSVTTLAPLTPWLATAGLGWLYYRRIRRHFGRQVYRPGRTVFRLVLLAVISAAMLCAAILVPHVALGMASGAACGIGLGWLALRHTHAAIVDGVPGYTPNPWIGGLLSVLLIARLAWRWQQGAFTSGLPAHEQMSPLTLAFLAALIAYSLVNSVGLVLRMRALARDAASAKAATVDA